MPTESLAVVAAGLAAFALVVSVVLLGQVGRLRWAYDGLVHGEQGGSFVSALEGTQALRSDVARLREEVGTARTALADALRHVAVVRYDAFGDMGGRLSFSVALLDDAGDGLVLTSINSRTETRTYCKGVQGARSEHELSPEEEQAITHASRSRAGQR